jgi:hypothetical protein
VAAFELALTEDIVKDFNKNSKHVTIYLYSNGELQDAFSSGVLKDLNYI